MTVVHTERTVNLAAASTPLARLTEQARRAPSALAIEEVDGRRSVRRISRGQLVTRVHDVMRGLAACGFVKGDRVLFSVRPGIESVILVLAVHELGGVLVPQDPGTSDSLFESRVALLRPRWVFAESVLLVDRGGLVARLLRWRGAYLAPLGAVPGTRVLRVGPWLPGLPDHLTLRQVEVRGRELQADATHATHAMRGDTSAETTSPPVESSDPGEAASLDFEAFIVCTSGTASDPKAVVHTRRSLAAILSAVERELAIDDSHVVYGKDLHLVLPALSVGARVVMPRSLAMHPDRTLDALAAHGVTHAFLVTRDGRLLLETCLAKGRRMSDSLQSLMIGAAPVRAGFLSRLREILPPQCTAWCVYGATEVLPVARVSLEEKVSWTGDGDLVGRAIDGLRVRIGGDQQLLVSGERLCAGYLGEDPFDEYATGDLARIDDGRIVLLGRLKDMLIRGDHNIYPELYEPLVERVQGVRRAAIVGDFDPLKADERVILVVEPEDGEDPVQLLNRVMIEVRTGAHRFDALAIPDEVLVRALPEAGRSGKIDKRALRASLGARDAGQP